MVTFAVPKETTASSAAFLLVPVLGSLVRNFLQAVLQSSAGESPHRLLCYTSASTPHSLCRPGSLCSPLTVSAPDPISSPVHYCVHREGSPLAAALQRSHLSLDSFCFGSYKKWVVFTLAPFYHWVAQRKLLIHHLTWKSYFLLIVVSNL